MIFFFIFYIYTFKKSNMNTSQCTYTWSPKTYFGKFEPLKISVIASSLQEARTIAISTISKIQNNTISSNDDIVLGDDAVSDVREDDFVDDDWNFLTLAKVIEITEPDIIHEPKITISRYYNS